MPKNFKRILIVIFWLLPILTFISSWGGWYLWQFQNQPIAENILLPKFEKIEPAEVILIAVGDIMLSRSVEEKMFAAQDYTLPFSKTWKLLSSANLTIGNLESPFYNQGPRVTKGMVFKAEPEAMAGLKLAGFDVLSLANNHTLNQGIKGLEYTLDYLKENNILTIGAGRDFAGAHQPAIVSSGDLTFGFLAYSYADYHDSAGQEYVVAGLNIEQAQKDIEILRDKVDLIIVSMHAGVEYVTEPNWQQENFARAVVEAGADLVIGHHPHWPQIVENYQDKWIFYSLGNFIFDQEWSQETKTGLILQAVWRETELEKLKLIPVIIENYSTPRLADEIESQKILNQIGLAGKVVFQR